MLGRAYEVIWLKRFYLLLKLEKTALYFANLQLYILTSFSWQLSTIEMSKVLNRCASKIMNIELALPCDSLMKCVTMDEFEARVLAVLHKLVTVLKESSTDPASISAADQIGYSTSCLDKALKISKCLKIRNLDACTYTQNRNFRN